MKWGRKKPSSSFISHVFPISWLSKFKQKSRDVEPKPCEVERFEANWNSCGNARGGGRFYGGEGDDFWRLSFGKEGVEGKSNSSALTSVWYNSDNMFDNPPSTWQSSGSKAKTLMGKEETQMFDNLSLNSKKIRESSRNAEIFPSSRDAEIFPHMDACKGVVHEAVIMTPRVKVKKLKKDSRLSRSSSEREEKSRKSVEKDNLKFEQLRTILMMQRQNCKLPSAHLEKRHHLSSRMSKNSNSIAKEDGVVAAGSLNGYRGSSVEKMSSDWEELKWMKIKELKSKNEKHRKSMYSSRELQKKGMRQSSKVKVSSPRIKALQDMKKAKMKMRKGKEKTMEGGTDLESFAVVKTSCDPQKDFQDSMYEMIMEKKISQPEELEELLACYLTLNSDEYHDLIIRVFQQVWYEMNQACFDNELQNENYFHN